MVNYTSKQAMLDMFLDRTARESGNHDRLATIETEGGNVALIGYGWIKLAEYDESRNVVTVFTGHTSIRSNTVNTWLNDVVRRAESRGRDVVLSGESPSIDTPNDGVQYVNEYVSFSADQSAVERDAINHALGSISVPF